MAVKSRLEVGVDVPWVTSWSEETVLGATPCPAVDGALAIHQLERPGIGRPNYSRNHLNRQRWSMRRMLCPMCGKPTAAGDRWTQTGRLVAAGALRAQGFGRSVLGEIPDAQLVLSAGAIAPLHRSCAERALQHCPFLGALDSAVLLPFPAVLRIFPLNVAAGASHALAASTPTMAVSFLQLCGLTDQQDPRWRERLR